MKIDLSCPIELRGYALSAGEKGVQATLRLYNLSPRRIVAFEAAARWRRPDGLSMVCPFSCERPRAGGHEMFQHPLLNDRIPDADGLEILFSSVRFDDGEWHAGEGPFAEIGSLPAMSDEELAMLKAVAGEDAVCHPRQDSRTWLCVCGRTNSNAQDICVRCGRDHFTALGHTPENIRFHYESAKSAPRAEATPSEVLARRFLRRRAKLFRGTLFTVLMLLAITAFFALQSPEPQADASSTHTVETVVQNSQSIDERP